MTAARADTAHFDDVILDPSKFFKTPDDVLASGAFTHDQKAEILDRWKDDCIQLMRAADESMVGGEQNHLAAVEKAMERLGS